MRAATWVKMIIGGGAMCIGGPALVIYVMPTHEELFKRYNPELQRRSLEQREQAEEDFDKFVGKLKEYSKSDKPIWTVWEQDLARQRTQEAKQQKQVAVQAELDRRKAADAEAEAQRQEMRRSLGK